MLEILDQAPFQLFENVGAFPAHNQLLSGGGGVFY